MEFAETLATSVSSASETDFVTVLSFVALRCGDLDRTKAFYECLGCSLRREQHGSGPVPDYSTGLGELVLELYPDVDSAPAALSATLGLVADGGELSIRTRLADRDGRTIMLQRGPE